MRTTFIALPPLSRRGNPHRSGAEDVLHDEAQLDPVVRHGSDGLDELAQRDPDGASADALLVFSGLL
jgi:hypothetical protein